MEAWIILHLTQIILVFRHVFIVIKIAIMDVRTAVLIIVIIVVKGSINMFQRTIYILEHSNVSINVLLEAIKINIINSFFSNLLLFFFF